MRRRLVLSLAVSAGLIGPIALRAAAAPLPALAVDGLYICAEHADPDDWDAEFSKGPVLVPAGTVFEYAGHIIGGSLLDPKDSAHFEVGVHKEITPEEKKRRSSLIAEDMSIDRKHSSAAVTTILLHSPRTPRAPQSPPDPPCPMSGDGFFRQ